MLTNEILRRDWKTVYQSTARCRTDAPDTWRMFWRQQLRWGRSSQRETILSLPWLWRKPAALFIFLNDMITPIAVYALVVATIAHHLQGSESNLPEVALPWQLVLAYAGMVVSVGLRQLPHLRRKPSDFKWLPVFVLQLTFFMVPTRLAACATMFHQSWKTREAPETRHSASIEAVPETGISMAFEALAASLAVATPVPPQPAALAQPPPLAGRFKHPAQIADLAHISRYEDHDLEIELVEG